MKRVLSAMLVFALLLCLCGCGKKNVYTLHVEDIGDYTVIGAPEGVVNYSTQENDIRVTVNKDASYPFTVKDADGNEYSFELVYENGDATIEAQEGLQVTLTKE